jgi:hypothetical protein
MADQNYSITSGDVGIVTVNIVDENGAAEDVSTALAVVYTLFEAAGGAVVASKSLGAGVAVAGAVVTVTLTGADTADVAGMLYHELQVTDEFGNDFTALTGYVLVEGDSIT